MDAIPSSDRQNLERGRLCKLASGAAEELGDGAVHLSLQGIANGSDSVVLRKG